ncbi:MAG: hypothetical protein R6U17_00385 [Thermoplasmata archaeon]
MKLTYKQFIGLMIVISTIFLLINIFSPYWGPFAIMGTLIIIFVAFKIYKYMESKEA